MQKDIQQPPESVLNQGDLAHISPSLRPLAVSLDSLVFDPANARTHSPRNLDVIRGSLVKFGQVKPIVIDAKGVVLAGNGSLQAAKLLGWKFIAAVRVDMSDAAAASFSVADNRSAELAGWDDHALAAILQSLKSEDELLAATGFDPGEVERLILAAGGGGELPVGAEGREYSEDVANDVDLVTCPHCGKEFAS